MSSYTNKLIITPQASGNTFTLWHMFTYEVGSLGSRDRINVPRNFWTDLASIPKSVRFIFPVLDRHLKAAVVHDYLYKVQTRSRKESDEIFLEAMKVSKVKPSTRWIFYRAVRMFGWISWNKNKEASVNNE